MDSLVQDRARRLLAAPAVRAFAAAVADVPPGAGPFTSYVGFNVTRDRVLNAKAYAHYFRRLARDEVARLLPRTEDFWRHYDRWQPSAGSAPNRTGCAFAAKVADPDPGAAPTHQYHYRFPFTPDVFDWLGVPADDVIDFRDYVLAPGVSVEYTGAARVPKRYFYLTRRREKARLAERFAEPWCRDAGVLEYTATDRFEKVILWIEHASACARYVRALAWPALDALVAAMAPLGCVPMFPGLYAGGEVRAVYFFRFPVASDAPFEHPGNRQVDTLRALAGVIAG